VITASGSRGITTQGGRSDHDPRTSFDGAQSDLRIKQLHATEPAFKPAKGDSKTPDRGVHRPMSLNNRPATLRGSSFALRRDTFSGIDSITGELKAFEGVVQSVQDFGPDAPEGRRWHITLATSTQGRR